MKRLLAMLMILLLMTGCSQRAPTPVKPETPPAVEENEPISTPETVPAPDLDPAPEPVPEPAPEPVPEVKPQPAPQLEPVPAPQPEPAPEPAFDWAAYVAESCAAITSLPEFNVLVWQENDARTDLLIRQGENDGNVDHLNYYLSSYTWTEASFDDWMAMAEEKNIGTQVSFWDVEGESGVSFTSCEKNDLVCITDPTKITYLRAVDAQGNGSLYDLMSLVAEDAVNAQVWNVTVDGTVSPNEAAGRMAEKIAENYRGIPDWILWKPESVRALKAEVYDLYHGTPEEFCFNLGLGVKVTDPTAASAGYWQAGAGLEEPDEEGFYGWRHQVWVQKNENGDWELKNWGTGGYTVMPRNTENKSQLAWLVEVFCLSEGFTHDWVAPNQILNLDPEELATLPEVLDQLTEAESKALCQTLGKLLKENDCWILEADDLVLLLGDYAEYLNV